MITISNPTMRIAYECVASKDAFERSAQIMSTEVSIPCSGRYNSKYDGMDLHRSLMAISISNGFAESGMQKLSIEAASLGRVPSGSWVRDTVEKKIPEKEMNEKLEHALDSTLTKLKAYGIFSMPVMAAIDKHKLPRYDEGIECFLTRRKKDRGTTKFETYATLQSVEEGRRAQIACEHVDFFDENFDVVQRLLTGAKLNDVSISLLLADREFFSCKTIRVLEKLHQLFLIPCRLTKRIKQAILEYSLGKRKSISDYTLRSGEKEEASFTLVILPRAGCAESETDPLKKYYLDQEAKVFA